MDVQISESNVDSKTSTNDIENLLNIFTNNQVKVGANGVLEFQGSDLLMTTVGRTLEVKSPNGSYQIVTDTFDDNVRTPLAGDLSLNSSGYVSNASPESLSSSSSSIHISPNITLSFETAPNQVDGIDLSKIVDSSLPTNPNIEEGSKSVQLPPNPNVHVSRVSMSTIPPGSDQQPHVQSPEWLKTVYPELYILWYQTSASELYQGGVRLLCSSCKRESAAGFHEGLPICDKCKMGRPCTLCRIRTVSSLSFGLALCEADKIFLYRCFTNRSVFPKCPTYCPVTVQRWCNYCRLRTGLATKGFRFYFEQKPGGESASSSDVDLHESRAKPITLANRCQDQTKGLVTSSQVSSPKSFSPFLHPGDVSRQSQVDKKPLAPASARAASRQQDTVIQARPYDGARLGLRGQRGPGSGYGFNNDPTKLSWVSQQQEKYLQHHLALYRERLKWRK